MKTLASHTLQLQQGTSIRNLETQVSQLENIVGRLEAQGSCTLPSQTIMNPKENMSAIILRRGKQLDEITRKVTKAHDKERQKKDLPGKKDEATTPIEIGEPPKKMPRTDIQPVVLPFHS